MQFPAPRAPPAAISPARSRAIVAARAIQAERRASSPPAADLAVSAHAVRSRRRPTGVSSVTAGHDTFVKTGM
jgi:hypothetical protein